MSYDASTKLKLMFLLAYARQKYPMYTILIEEDKQLTTLGLKTKSNGMSRYFVAGIGTIVIDETPREYFKRKKKSTKLNGNLIDYIQ